MKKTLILLTALITVGLIATTAFSRGHGYGHGSRGYGSCGGQSYGAMSAHAGNSIWQSLCATALPAGTTNPN